MTTQVEAEVPDPRIGSWGYRIVCSEITYPRGGVYSEFSIVEVYYDTAGEITGWVDQKVAPFGGAMDELVADLGHMVKAVALPVVNRKDLPGV